MDAADLAAFSSGRHLGVADIRTAPGAPFWRFAHRQSRRDAATIGPDPAVVAPIPAPAFPPAPARHYRSSTSGGQIAADIAPTELTSDGSLHLHIPAAPRAAPIRAGRTHAGRQRNQTGIIVGGTARDGAAYTGKARGGLARQRARSGGHEPAARTGAADRQDSPQRSERVTMTHTTTFTTALRSRAPLRYHPRRGRQPPSRRRPMSPYALIMPGLSGGATLRLLRRLSRATRCSPAPIICDAEMVSRVTAAGCPPTMRSSARCAAHRRHRRGRSAIRAPPPRCSSGDRLGGAVVAIGNAPTACSTCSYCAAYRSGRRPSSVCQSASSVP